MSETKKVYSCELCLFNTVYKTRYDEHLLTIKHNAIVNKKSQEHQKNHKTYVCNICNKTYSNRSGLWKHNKNCNDNKQKQIVNELKETIFNELKNDIFNNNKTNEENLKYQELQIKYYELKLFLMSHKEKLLQNGVEIPQDVLN